MLKKLSYKLLRAVERFYLYTHGWRKLAGPEEKYLPPADYPFTRHADYVRVHAVNAQRQTYAKTKPTQQRGN